MELAIVTLLVLIFIETTFLVLRAHKKTLRNKRGSRPILLDTSAIMDGRIVSVAESGFIGDTIFVPRSVIGELQLLADTGDADKRAKARAGLDIVKFLQDLEGVEVEILQDGSIAREGVDERLLKLAKEYSAAICTLDFNLNKVAQVEKIKILNINELAQNLRIAYLPGEKISLEIIQTGSVKHQGIGYIEDGTMVVVEQASQFIGKKIEVECIRALQTAAGKMLFAKIPPEIQLVTKKAEKKHTQGRKAITEIAKKVEEVVQKVQIKPPHIAKTRKPVLKKSVKPSKKITKKNGPKTSSDREDDLIDLINSQK